MPVRYLIPLFLIVALAGGCKRREQPVAATQTGTQEQQTQTQSAPTTTGVEVGATMPDYSASLVDGSKFELAGERGKVVLVNLWATWCGPCREEMPDLQALHDRYSARGFKVIGVSVDESGAEVVKPFIAEEKITYPIVLDPDGNLAGVLNTQVLPTTVLLDRKGKIVWKRSGQLQRGDSELTQAIEKAL